MVLPSKRHPPIQQESGPEVLYSCCVFRWTAPLKMKLGWPQDFSWGWWMVKPKEANIAVNPSAVKRGLFPHSKTSLPYLIFIQNPLFPSALMFNHSLDLDTEDVGQEHRSEDILQFPVLSHNRSGIAALLQDGFFDTPRVRTRHAITDCLKS